MASPAGDAADDFASSLFDGMVLFSPSDLSQPPLADPQPPSRPPPPPAPAEVPSLSPPDPSPAEPPTSQPLDEDLFSDLTLQTPDPVPPTTPHPAPPSRQISRKKKRAVRIGYARDAAPEDPDPDPNPLPPSPPPHPSNPVADSPVLEADKKDDGAVAQEEVPAPAASEKEDVLASIQEKLRLVKAKINENSDQIREKAALVSVERKELGRRRRKAAEDLVRAEARHRELERELEEACEAEDFEKAEVVSERLAEKEKEKDGLLGMLRDAELECDAMDEEMQKVLELQIAAEEEGAAMLEQFAEDAANHADLVLKNAEEISMKELEEWESSMELLEIKRIEMDIESQLIREARAGLNHSLEHMVEEDRKEQEKLIIKRDVLEKELDELLELVKLKQAEIGENDSQIQQVEKRISDVFSEFHETRSNIDVKHDSLQSSLSKIESDGEGLQTKKKEMDEFISLAQQKQSKLKELANVSLDEARTCQDLVELRKTLAASILKSNEDKVRLAKTEEKILEDIHILREQISTARTSLQELSSNRASLQQQVASFKQRMEFIDKRGPELEAEKKVAAAARNFKEAGRIAAEAKALNVERESLQSKSEKAVSDLEKLEEEIKDTLDKIQESEGLISFKEKEAATAGCKRLRLVAAALRAERSAALELGDTKEGDILLKESEDAESKARELQEAYNLEWEEHGKAFEHVASISLVTNFAGQHLGVDAKHVHPDAY